MNFTKLQKILLISSGFCFYLGFTTMNLYEFIFAGIGLALIGLFYRTWWRCDNHGST